MIISRPIQKSIDEELRWRATKYQAACMSLAKTWTGSITFEEALAEVTAAYKNKAKRVRNATVGNANTKTT